jgi:subtilisin family serine protease
MPLVINMSFGHITGPHDGTDPVDQMLDTFLNPTIPPAHGTPATVLVASAGNEGEPGKHATGTIPGNAVVKRIRFKLKDKVIEGGPSTIMEIRFTAPNGLICKLIPPGNKTNGPTLAQADTTVNFIETKENSICMIQGLLVGGAVPTERRILVSVTQPNKKKQNKAGTWVLEVSNAGANPITYHAWIDGDQEEEILDETTLASTISSPGSARDVITVGAYHPVGKDKGKLAKFSSRGPRLDGVAKPDLSAPGVDVKSAKRDFHDGCCCDCCCGSYIIMQGTSMSAPHVTGAAALLLERNPALTAAQVKSVLMDTARRENFTGMTLPNFEFGNGKLHVLNALNDVRVRGAGPVITGGGGGASRVSEHSELVEAAHAALKLPQLEEGTPLSRLLRSREGRRLYERGVAHWEEARELVNADKRVATVWHRNHGPLVLHHVIRATMLPDVPLPGELEGEELAVRAARLVTALEKHASKELIRALHATLPLVRQLQGKTLREVVELFEARGELQHA